MKEKLKGFFKKHIDDNGTVDEIKQKVVNTTDSTKDAKTTYEEFGYKQAEKQNGNHLAFSGNLNLVREDYVKSERTDRKKIDEERAKAQSKYDKIIAENEARESTIEILKKRIEDFKEKNDELKRDILEIEKDPTKVLPDKTNKVGMWIGIVILAFLTVYLFIFYSSASYSGFFKDFSKDFLQNGNEGGIANAIFDSQAVSKAFNDGFTEVILILTVPFIFLALGYLIHEFQKGKGVIKYFKIATLIFITFAFDALLAYKIEAGLYEVKVLNAIQDLPPHALSMAISSENFWLVIFAGFVVYLIWGFVFDFVMESYANLDIVNKAIRAKQNEIELHNEDIKKIEQDIHNKEIEIEATKPELRKYLSLIEGNTYIINWLAFEKVLLEFVTGWTHWMTYNVPKPAIDRTWEIYREYIDKHKTSLEDTKNNNNNDNNNNK